MRVRPFLALRVGARSVVLDEDRWRVQTAVRLDRQRFDTATAVIGDENSLAGPIHKEMARAVATGRLLIQGNEFARARVDDKSAHCSALFAVKIANLIRRIKKSPVGMKGEETWTDCFGGQFRRVQFAARRSEAGDINPFTLWAGVSADVNEKLFRVARRLRRCATLL